MADPTRYRLRSFWRCTWCGGYYSLWEPPTLWEHLREAHGYDAHTVAQQANGRRSAPRVVRPGRRLVALPVGPYRWVGEGYEAPGPSPDAIGQDER